jgi:hypothetical protein
MPSFHVGITEGRSNWPDSNAPKPREINLEYVEAKNDQDAIAQAQTAWRETYRDEPPSALIGVSGPGPQGPLPKNEAVRCFPAPKYARGS